MEHYLYQKDLYLLLGGKTKSKPTNMDDSNWELLNRKALGTIRLYLGASIAFNISNEKTTKGVMKKLVKMHEKPSMTNNVFLIKKLFNMQMVEEGSISEHVNDFSTVTNQLNSVKIDIDDEIRALLFLCSFSNS